jgi:predicted ATPase/DNA-binding CsgD family transcriptional regulator
VSADDDSGNRDGGEIELGNLPAPLTRLVGREDALSELRALVWSTRLLSLCGPGGVGKTRLGIALADTIQADFVDGAWWVDLSSTMDSADVAQVVAAAVLPGEVASDSAAPAVARRLADSSLLVLDNCEQVIDGCAELVTDLLARSQALRVIATSRQPLGVPGEQVWRVPGLRISEGALTEALDGGAIALFLERAREAASSFEPATPGVREAVKRICTWLDGMPLAIELAAARVPVLGVAQIAQRLERDSGFLRHSSRRAPARHRTLPETLDWSHRMLEPAEQSLFRRLGSFRGSFSLTAAEAVCEDGSLAADDVLDLLGLLVDRSLVQVVEHGEEVRYTLLAVVRQYAARKLDESGEAPEIRRRHSRFYYDLAQGAQAGLAGGDQGRWLDHLELEHDNLIEALLWLSAELPNDAARLASMLWPFWYQHGYYREARTWFERLLAAGSDLPAAARADVLLKAGEVAFLQCDYELAIAHLNSALELITESGDRRSAATALQRLGAIAREQNRNSEARELHEQSLEIWRELGDRRGIAASQNYLGFVAWLAGDCAGAETLCADALSEFERLGALQDVAGTLVNLGAGALYRGELQLASDRLEEALAISRRLGFQEGIAWSLHELAIVGRRHRRPLREQALMLRDSLLVHHQLGDRWRLASVLEEIAGSVLARQDPRRAVEMLAYTETLREQLRTPIPAAEKPERDAALNRLRARLSQARVSAAWSEGRTWELDRAVDAAVAAIDQMDGTSGEEPQARSTPILTSRELAVLDLLAKGHTNREIAATLYISASTAGVHVSNILRKLGAKRRVDAAGLAHSLGLLSVG